MYQDDEPLFLFEDDEFEGYDAEIVGTFIAHSGVGHLGVTEEGKTGESGRYQYGSGKNPYQHAKDFLDDIERYRYENEPFIDEHGNKFTGDQAIVKRLGLRTVTELKAQIQVAQHEKKLTEYAKIWKLLDEKNEDGTPKYNTTQIAKKMGYNNESSIRNIRDNKEKLLRDSVSPIADMLKKQCDEGSGLIDVGKDAEKRITNCSRNKLDQALAILKMQGYENAPVRVKQAGSQNYTTVQVLRRPDRTWADAHELKTKIEVCNFKIDDNTHTVNPIFVRPKAVDHNRIFIRYKDSEESGVPKDGLVEIRPGVPDLDLGGSHYCQVRINVDDKYYIKGMACYSDDVPEGYDMILNSNKSSSKGWEGALKKLKHVGETDDHPAPPGAPIDWENPFKALITPGIYDPEHPNENVHGGQSYYFDPKTGKKELSAINKRSDEGEWGEWSKEIPSQFLSKQTKTTVEKQLKITKEQKQKEFDEIMSLNNPTIKKYLLEKFASTCDSGATQLKAATIPGAKYQVLLPVPSLKDNEVYAPNFENGTKLALVRFPHSGTFEIPYLTVNNNNKEAISLYTRAAYDMVGINSNTAAQLSGADFDGDTALCIPITNKFDVSHRPYLEGLKDFDMDALFKLEIDESGKLIEGKNRPGAKLMEKANVQMEMGKISNLITDMTLAGAPDSELERAVKHSMVVIDAFKHHYDYQLSEQVYNIKELKKKYQHQTIVNPVTGETQESEGAGTIISRSSKAWDVPKTRGSGRTDPVTGEVKKELQNDEDLYYYKVAVQRPVLDAEGKPVYKKDGTPKVKKEWVDAYQDKKTGKWFRYGENLKDENGNEVRKANGKYAKERVDIPENSELKKFTRTEKASWMSLVDDANKLVNGNEKEYLYADYANFLKALANKSRLEILKKDEAKRDPAAAEKYADEVNSLLAKLNASQMNSPLERQAQRRMHEIVNKQLLEDPTLINSGDKKKLEQKAITKARAEIGAHRVPIVITDKEWEAIQAHAISKSKLQEIMQFVDDAKLKQLAMPRKEESIPENKLQSFYKMIKQTVSVNGKPQLKYTNEDLADYYGVSISTIIKYRESM